MLLKPGERLDDLQRNGFRIIQDPGRFCFGMDAVLLAGFADKAVGERLLDIGTGTGILPILMAARTAIPHIFGIEIQEESADMARRSVELNGLEGRIEIVTGDVKEADRWFGAASFDVATCNPPYMADMHGLQNAERARTIARHEVCCTFQDIAGMAAKLLKPGGHLYLVHRPFRLAEILVTLSGCKLEPKRMQFVHPYVDREPSMVLIEAVRGGKPRMSVEKPLIVQERPGVYMPEIREKYGY